MVAPRTKPRLRARGFFISTAFVVGVTDRFAEQISNFHFKDYVEKFRE